MDMFTHSCMYSWINAWTSVHSYYAHMPHKCDISVDKYSAYYCFHVQNVPDPSVIVMECSTHPHEYMLVVLLHRQDVFVDNYPSKLKPWTLLNFAGKLGYVPSCSAQTFCQGVLTMWWNIWDKSFRNLSQKLITQWKV